MFALLTGIRKTEYTVKYVFSLAFFNGPIGNSHTLSYRGWDFLGLWGRFVFIWGHLVSPTAGTTGWTGGRELV